MSSSMFIEPSADNADKTDGQHTSDSNLVVVYGKSGVNIDPNDLEKLIEEKAVQSISVIRLTSPTPSMEDAEEAARLEAEKNAQDSAADSEEQTDTETTETKLLKNNEKSDADSDEVSSNLDESEDNDDSQEDENSEDGEKVSKKRNRKLNRNKLKTKRKVESKKQEIKPRTELVGLTFEGFYEAEAALEIAKEACKMAGIYNAAEYESLLLVIRNDHCYTPFTSPEQMKAKLAADKLEAEKLAANARKVQLPQLNAQSKQMIVKSRKQQLTGTSVLISKATLKKPLDDTKMRRNVKEKLQHEEDEAKLSNSADDGDEDEETYELIDIDDSDYTASEQSAETDNDRDSDLDFDVNNRQLKKRKTPHGLKKSRKVPFAKQIFERNTSTSNATIVTTGTSSTVTAGAIPQRTTPSTKPRSGSGNITITQRQMRAPQILPIGNLQKFSSGTITSAGAATASPKVIVNKLFTKPTTVSVTPITQRSSQQILQIPMTQQTTATESPPRTRGITKMQSPQQNIKEIMLNKVMSSPKGGFTELTTLISAEEKSMQLQQQQLVSQKSASIIQQNLISTDSSSSGGTNTSSRSGFIVIDAASKNQLPAQISLETHHSSNELAAEHDKQLDLIDSIVKDELNKSIEEEIAEKHPTTNLGINENIPKLVEMLESTEKALESNQTTINVASVANPKTTLNTNLLNSTSVAGDSAHVDDIDISHDLPEDLLQHVVELIEDDKTLQEAVEKQILEQSLRNDGGAVVINQTIIQQPHQQLQVQKINDSNNDIGFSNLTTVPSIQPIQSNETTTILPLVTTQPTTTKSIIQMSISNVNSPTTTIGTSPSFTPKSSPLVRRDPIQIVRGNGRVITLPPIEAPTTRAKRRAQVAPSPGGQQSLISEQNVLLLNESSLDSSMHSNMSFNATSTMPATEMHIATTTLDESIIEKKQRDTTRRASKEVASGSNAKGSRKSAANKSKAATVVAEDTEASESQGDDDDPNKLWCICRQPHNNRFMICCDACGEWFHGKCVNITKAMGRDMEQKGVEWSCPNCIKKRDEKKQRKLTDMLKVRRSNSQSSTDEKTKSQNVVIAKTLSSEITSTTTDDTTKNLINLNKKETSDVKKIPSSNVQILSLQTPTATKKTSVVVTSGQKKLLTKTTPPILPQNKAKVFTTTPVRLGAAHVKTPQTNRSMVNPHKNVSSVTSPSPQKPIIPTIPCVVCKKNARPNTVYCSDECIRRCAQNAINIITAKSAENIDIPSSSGSSGIMDDKKKKAKGLFEDLLSMADRKPKIERITVYDRKSGTKLSGSNAPTTATIKKWLHENPTYEIVLPGSQLSIEIEQKLQQQQQQQRTPATPAKSIANVARTPVSSAASSSSLNKSTEKLVTTPVSTKDIANLKSGHSSISPKTVKSIKQIVDEHKHTNRPTTPKQLQKYPQQVHIKSAKDETKTKSERNLKRQSSENSNTGASSSHKKSNVDSSSSSSTPTPTDSEPIRMSVRRTLKEQILQRIKESANETDIPKLTPDEVETFVKQTESEMYNFFNRETGTKYKTKYRQLMFNIKDRKNRTLFAKICAKQIEPKQLVHMQPEELASQELAQWRENEQKHQLEMIKKSELEMLSCTKNYLFKNHKGEEVIEGKETDVCVNLDLTTPVEELVNVLNSSTMGGSSFENDDEETVENIAKQLETTESEQDQSHHHHHHHHHHHEHHQHSIEERNKHRRDSEKEHRSKSKSRDRERESDRHVSSRNRDDKDEKEREKREGRRHRSRSRDRQRDHRHHRDKSRSRRRSHSRSKSRSRSQERRHKSSTQHRDRDREREREKEREREREREHEKDRKKSNADNNKAITSLKPSIHPSSSGNVVTQIQAKDKDKHRHSPVIIKQKSQQQQQQQTPLECFNLIDQIIESSKTVEEAANIVKEKNKEKEKLKEHQKSPIVATISSSSSTSFSHETAKIPPPTQIVSTSDSDQEPTSTVSIPTPPHDAYNTNEEPSFSRTNSPTTQIETLWSGIVCMSDVATVQINIQSFIGNSQHVGNLLPQNLEVVGRIEDHTVWEYLWKIRKSPNKEIVLIRLTPLNDDEIDEYAKLFTYLDQKKRLGVIQSSTMRIKDFYIYPFGAGKQLPKVLQVTNQKDFYNNSNTQDILVGILVYVIGKRSSAVSSGASISALNVSNSAQFGSTASSKLSRRIRTEVNESFTPPGSPKRKKRTHKTEIDIDAIIKAPIIRKPATTSSVAVEDDADEPYSPGGSSDDDVSSMYTAKATSVLTADDDLKRKMEEINRKIAAQEMEIAGLLKAEPTAASASVLANISIPSNLPQILASINKVVPTTSQGNRASQMSAITGSNEFEEYNPEDSILAPTTTSSSYTASVRHTLNQPTLTMTTSKMASSSSTAASTSRLAQLSEAELLSMVPDDVLIEPALTSTKQPTLSPYYKEPPPPGV